LINVDIGITEIDININIEGSKNTTNASWVGAKDSGPPAHLESAISEKHGAQGDACVFSTVPEAMSTPGMGSWLSVAILNGHHETRLSSRDVPSFVEAFDFDSRYLSAILLCRHSRSYSDSRPSQTDNPYRSIGMALERRRTASLPSDS
jgi:hypothetical protein